ncbi:uncharacterized protein O3C94_006247 [Discoglossus pictus]
MGTTRERRDRVVREMISQDSMVMIDDIPVAAAVARPARPTRARKNTNRYSPLLFTHTPLRRQRTETEGVTVRPQQKVTNPDPQVDFATPQAVPRLLVRSAESAALAHSSRASLGDQDHSSGEEQAVWAQACRSRRASDCSSCTHRSERRSRSRSRRSCRCSCACGSERGRSPRRARRSESPGRQERRRDTPLAVSTPRLPEAGGQKQLWIVGHSYVYWAHRLAAVIEGRTQLGFTVTDLHVRWFGVRGLRWAQLDELLNTCSQRYKEFEPAGADDFFSPDKVHLTEMGLELVTLEFRESAVRALALMNSKGGSQAQEESLACSVAGAMCIHWRIAVLTKKKLARNL